MSPTKWDPTYRKPTKPRKRRTPRTLRIYFVSFRLCDDFRTYFVTATSAQRVRDAIHEAYDSDGVSALEVLDAGEA